MKRYKLISIVFIIYSIVVYKYGVSCAKCNKLHPNTYNDYRDFDYKVRFGRQLKESDLNINSNGLSNKFQNSRGVPGSSRHLRLGDAHQVANYFLTDGPLKGHAHFIRDTTCESDNNGNNTTNENDTNVSMTQDLNATLSDSIVGAPLIPTLHPQLPPAPSNLNSILHPALHTLTNVPHLLLRQDLLNSILHPRLHPHINALHSIPTNLIQTAALPLNGLMHARTAIQDMLHPKGPLVGAINKASERAKARKNLKNSLKYPIGYPPIMGPIPIGFHNNVPLSNMIQPHLPKSYPQPTGYVVRYVPHTKHTIPASAIVGSPQQQPSNCADDNLNGKQNLTDSINDESEGTSESEKPTGENQDEHDNE